MVDNILLQICFHQVKILPLKSCPYLDFYVEILFEWILECLHHKILQLHSLSQLQGRFAYLNLKNLLQNPVFFCQLIFFYWYPILREACLVHLWKIIACYCSLLNPKVTHHNDLTSQLLHFLLIFKSTLLLLFQLEYFYVVNKVKLFEDCLILHFQEAYPNLILPIWPLLNSKLWFFL